MTMGRTAGVTALAVLAFLIFGMPRLNVRVGPIPLYIIDVVAIYILYSFNKRVRSGIRYPYRGIMGVVFVLIIASEFMALVYGGGALDTVYLALRWSLAIGVFFAIPSLLNTQEDVAIVLKAITLGGLITAVLMIMTSLPMTRALVATTVFQISSFEPAVSATNRYLNTFEDAGGVRGRSLVGVSILSSTYVAIAWPLVAFLRTGPFRLNAFWDIASLTFIFVAPLAVVMSYSRQAALAAILVFLGVIILPAGKLRRGIVRPVVLSVTLVAVVGVGSSVFFFDRYVNRVSAMIEAPLDDAREYDRLLSYVEPFSHASQNPMFLILGEGTAMYRTNFSEQSGKPNHSLMGAGYFAHGLISTLLLWFLIFGFYSFANWHRKNAALHYLKEWPRAVFLAFLPVLCIAAFSPGLGNHPKVMYAFIFVLALISALRNGIFVPRQNPHGGTHQ